MIKTIYNNISFNNNQKNNKLSTDIYLQKSFTPIKIMPKDKINFKDNFNTNIVEVKKLNKLYSNKNKNKNNIKLKLLNPTKKNSRNLSSLNGLNSTNTFTKSNYIGFHTNNSLSVTTNLKTTMDTNMTKTQYMKDKINNKENSSFHDSKSNTIFSSSLKGWKKSVNVPIRNISQIKKRPKIKIPTTNSNIFIKFKNKKNDQKIYNYSKKNNENKNTYNNSKNINNNSFIIPKRINTLKDLYNNVLTPMRVKTKIKFQNSLSLNKKINKMEKNINIINKKQKKIDNSKISIKKNKLKNMYMLLEKQKEAISYKDEIKKEKEEIEIIMDKLKKVKEKTIIINNEAKRLNIELIKNKKEIKIIKEDSNSIINDKKNVNTMIVLLHRRIIDTKKRIKDLKEENYYLDKSFYELGLKYQDINNINNN